MQKLSRRTFTQEMLNSLLTFSLVKTLCASELLATPVKPIAERWLLEVEQFSREMKNQRLPPVEWQRKVEELFTHLELADLLRSIDYRRLAKHAVFPEDHESAEFINLPQTAGLPAEPAFDPFFYALKKGRAIVPHGHHNMTSMHMILDGQAHAWHYDRVETESRHLIIKPTFDKVFARGNLSTISDQKDNIHWFKALTDTVFMFNIGVFGIDPTTSFFGRDYIDPLGGEKMKDGLIRARRIEAKEAYKLYGKS